MKPSSIEIRDRYGSMVAQVEGTKVTKRTITQTLDELVDAALRVLPHEGDYTKGCLRDVFRKILS